MNGTLMLAGVGEERARRGVPHEIFAACLKANCAHCNAPIVFMKNTHDKFIAAAELKNWHVFYACEACAANHKPDMELVCVPDPEFVKKALDHMAEMN